jgi:putative endonuclease
VETSDGRAGARPRHRRNRVPLILQTLQYLLGSACEVPFPVQIPDAPSWCWACYSAPPRRRSGSSISCGVRVIRADPTSVSPTRSPRLADHNPGRCPHTARYRPWQLHVTIELPDEERAIAFERYLKIRSGRAFAKRRLAFPNFANHRSSSRPPSRRQPFQRRSLKPGRKALRKTRRSTSEMPSGSDHPVVQSVRGRRR